jgi:hypothetical protein
MLLKNWHFAAYAQTLRSCWINTWVAMLADRWINEKIDRLRDRQIETYRERQTDRQAHRQTDRQTCISTDGRHTSTLKDRLINGELGY